jgi:hypothetical protein
MAPSRLAIPVPCSGPCSTAQKYCAAIAGASQSPGQQRAIPRRGKISCSDRILRGGIGLPTCWARLMITSLLMSTVPWLRTKPIRQVRTAMPTFPTAVNLSNPSLNRQYQTATITIPGLGLPDTASTATIPGTRVVWGLTILKSAPNPGNAVKFSNFCSARKVSLCRQRWDPLRSVRRLSA